MKTLLIFKTTNADHVGETIKVFVDGFPENAMVGDSFLLKPLFDGFHQQEARITSRLFSSSTEISLECQIQGLVFERLKKLSTVWKVIPIKVW